MSVPVSDRTSNWVTKSAFPVSANAATIVDQRVDADGAVRLIRRPGSVEAADCFLNSDEERVPSTTVDPIWTHPDGAAGT